MSQPRLAFLARPRWIAFHLLCLATVFAMLSLSAWQFRRLDARREFNSAYISRTEMPPVDITSLIGKDSPAEDLSGVEWRKVGAIGTYLADEQVILLNRSQGGVAGVDIVTPLHLVDGDVILVNRGFIPLNAPVPAPPTGEVKVLGLARAFETRRTGGAVDPEGERQEFFTLDYSRLDAQIEQPLLRLVIDAGTSDPPDDPSLAPVAPPELSEGPHLSYAIQWIIFSIAVVVGWVLAIRRSISARGRAKPSA